jgi:hypothetical protein
MKNLSTNKRNAVILTGFMRNYEHTVENLKASMIDDSVDIFIAAWDYRGVKKLNKRIIKLTDGTERSIMLKDCENNSKINVDDIIERYAPKLVKVFDLDLFEESIEQYAKIVETSDLIDIHAKIKPKNYMTLMRRYSMFYMSYQGWKLMTQYADENNIKYENVAKVRADFDKGGYYPRIESWNDKRWKHNICIGNWNLQIYDQLDSRINRPFQDHFAIGPYDKMDVYFNMFNNLFNLSREFEYKSKMWHGEYCLSLWLTKNDVEWKIL